MEPSATIERVGNGYLITLTRYGSQRLVASTWAEMITMIETHFVEGLRYDAKVRDAQKFWRQWLEAPR